VVLVLMLMFMVGLDEVEEAIVVVLFVVVVGVVLRVDEVVWFSGFVKWFGFGFGLGGF